MQGEDVKKLDIVANDNFINTLKFSTKVSVMVSEENEEAIILPSRPHAKYVLVFDPLDGSSNIDCNVSVGSIFGIYARKDTTEASTVEDALQPGSALVAAGYCMYGSSTQMVLTFGSNVQLFTLDPSIGEFLLTADKVRVPDAPKQIYSCNEGNYASFPKAVQEFIDEAKAAEPPYSLRYVGSMVADVHRTLLYGGVFMYPATAKAPTGKLRLLYECNPMALIMEAAGGAASHGSGRILDIVPTSIHERAPIYIGCKRDVERLEQLLAKHGEAGDASAMAGVKRGRE